MKLVVSIVTFERPAMLERAVNSIFHNDGVSQFDVLIVNNGPTRLCADLGRRANVLEFNHGGIASARNAALEWALANGYTHLAFVDDDEYVSYGWLSALTSTLGSRPNATAIAGPVQPDLDDETAARATWLRRKNHAEGAAVPAAGAGNLLIQLERLENNRFSRAFETGGEDTELTLRLTRLGHEIYWSKDAMVLEAIPPERTTRAYFIKRNRRYGEILRSCHVLPHRRAARVGAVALLMPLYPLYPLMPRRFFAWWVHNAVRNLAYLTTSPNREGLRP